MTHDDEKNSKTLNTPEDPAALNAAEPSEIKRELTDDQIAAVAGGLNPQPLPPGRSKPT